MSEFLEGVPFDPGYEDLTIPFSFTAESVQFELSKYKAINQKKFRYRALEPVISAAITKVTAFYLGCILWAGYISCKFKSSPKKILNNPFLNIPQEKIDQLDFLDEVECLSNYFEKFEKDCRYFLGRSANIDPGYKTIVENYKEFLTLNNNFLQTTETSDIKLPEGFKYIEKMDEAQLDELYGKIRGAIQSGKIETLLSSCYEGVVYETNQV